MDTLTASHAFLFADLVGYTALTVSHGDERAADVATRFHTAVRELLDGDDRADVKTLGDGLMVRLDDAAGAVRLGVAIAEAVDGLDDVPAVRVGIHSGPAVHRDGDWYGSAVNVASRLCDAAQDGQVLVSADAAAAARERATGIAFGAPSLHRLKNLEAPVPASPARLEEPASPTAPSLRVAADRLRMRVRALTCAAAGQRFQGAH